MTGKGAQRKKAGKAVEPPSGPDVAKPKDVEDYFQDSEGEFSPEHRIAWSYFLKAYKVVTDTIDKDLRDGSSLSLAEFEMLFYLVASGGRLRFIDLSKLSLLSQSRVSRQIDSLRSKGFLLRESTDSDRRATFAVLTAAGQSAFNTAEAVFAEAFRVHFLAIIGKDRLGSLAEMMLGLMQNPEYLENSTEILNRARENAGLA